MCSTKALLGGDGDVVADIFRTRVLNRGKGSEVWGWGTAYGRPTQGKPGAAPVGEEVMSAAGWWLCDDRRSRALVACGEKVQTIPAGGERTPTRRPGRQDKRVLAPGWTPGDQASWERAARRPRPGPERLRAAQVSAESHASDGRGGVRRAPLRGGGAAPSRERPASRTTGRPSGGAGRAGAAQIQAMPSDGRSDRGPRHDATITTTALPEPQPTDTNAQRARSQPLNNAPFWRGVHESGRAPGSVNNLQVGERGVLIQPITPYPGNAHHDRRRSVAAVPQLVDHSLRRRARAHRRRRARALLLGQGADRRARAATPAA